MRLHLAFYKFVDLVDPQAVAAWLRVLTAGLQGSILVAHEGINGVLAGDATALDDFKQALCADPRFAGLRFTPSACTREPFGRMKVHVRPEIVSVGLPVSPPAGRTRTGGNAVSPAAWRRLIAEDDVVVLDNRNRFEFRLGHFKGAVDPGVSHFRDFPRYVEAHAAGWRAEGRRVAMYCTGGIRCEKTSAWMQETLGLEVWQLDGGILNYFQSLPDAERDWQGQCFVFDNRIALDTRLQPTATTPEQVYGAEPDAEWRLARARRLEASA